MYDARLTLNGRWDPNLNKPVDKPKTAKDALKTIDILNKDITEISKQEIPRDQLSEMFLELFGNTMKLIEKMEQQDKVEAKTIIQNTICR